MRHFNVLPNFPFTTSQTMCDYYLQIWYVRVPSRVTDPLNNSDLRKLGNVRKLSKLHIMIASAQSPCQNESFVNTRRKLLKIEIKLFPLSAIPHEN